MTKMEGESYGADDPRDFGFERMGSCSSRLVRGELAAKYGSAVEEDALR